MSVTRLPLREEGRNPAKKLVCIAARAEAGKAAAGLLVALTAYRKEFAGDAGAMPHSVEEAIETLCDLVIEEPEEPGQ
jgi:hypothetical protein